MYMYTNIQIIYIGSYQEVELQIYSSCEQQNYANNLNILILARKVVY
jgi:hypothetical protein